MRADGPHLTRSQRSAEAVKEVSSLTSSPPRGIDARSLAAKPPSFTIRSVRVGETFPRGRDRGSFSGFRGSGRAGRSGTGIRGRGGRGGRGAARGGRRARGKRTRGAAPREGGDADGYEIPPYSEEEKAWIDGYQAGFEIPYNPTTSLEDLRVHGASVMPPSSTMGIVESAVHKMQKATRMIGGPHTHGAIHLERMANGATIFETTENKAATQYYYDQARQSQENESAEKTGTKSKELESRRLRTLDTLPESVRNAVAKAWAGGHYVGPEAVKDGDILGQVQAYTRRNETYLSDDARKVKRQLSSLLPAQYQGLDSGKTPAGVQKPL